jgi:hypothetical protein
MTVGMTTWKEGLFKSHVSRLASVGAPGPVNVLFALGSITMTGFVDDALLLDVPPEEVCKVEE